MWKIKRKEEAKVEMRKRGDEEDSHVDQDACVTKYFWVHIREEWAKAAAERTAGAAVGIGEERAHPWKIKPLRISQLLRYRQEVSFFFLPCFSHSLLILRVSAQVISPPPLAPHKYVSS